MSLSEQIAAAWLVAVQTARICEDVSGHRHVLVDTSAILAVEAQLAEANKRAEALVGHLTTAERDLALALNTEENLRQALINAGHDPECPVVWGASGECVPGGRCVDWQRRAEVAERALAEARERERVLREACQAVVHFAANVPPTRLIAELDRVIERCRAALAAPRKQESLTYEQRQEQRKSQHQREWLEALEKAPQSIVIGMLEEVTEELRDVHEEAEATERALAEARERDLDALQADIGAWADHTFPSHYAPAGQPNLRGPIKHLTRPDKGEVWELVRAFEAGRPLNEEVADCITLLLTIAHLSGFSALEATRAKLAKNRQRQWGQPDPDGIVEHVREEAARG